MNDLITNHQDRMSDRNHTEIFALLPSIGLCPDFNIEHKLSKTLRIIQNGI